MATALEIVNTFYPRVTEVVDGKTPVVIDVTQKDCTPKGKKRHQHCAIAEACKRKFHLDGVIVSRTRAYLIKGRTAKRYNIPASVQKEVVAFDRGAYFAPGVYALSTPTQSDKLMGHQTGSDSRKARKRTGKKRFHHQTADVRTTLQGG